LLAAAALEDDEDGGEDDVEEGESGDEAKSRDAGRKEAWGV
jgi:hypothetical protein